MQGSRKCGARGPLPPIIIEGRPGPPIVFGRTFDLTKVLNKKKPLQHFEAGIYNWKKAFGEIQRA